MRPVLVLSRTLALLATLSIAVPAVAAAAESGPALSAVRVSAPAAPTNATATPAPLAETAAAPLVFDGQGEVCAARSSDLEPAAVRVAGAEPSLAAQLFGTVLKRMLLCPCTCCGGQGGPACEIGCPR